MHTITEEEIKEMLEPRANNNEGEKKHLIETIQKAKDIVDKSYEFDNTIKTMCLAERENDQFSSEEMRDKLLSLKTQINTINEQIDELVNNI